jgi:microcystin-dependent protein
MPIPSSIADLDTNPNNNSPQGSENVGPNANGYIQALGAFIKQIANGAGLKPTATVDFNAQKITNLANGTVSSTSKDAVTGAQLQAVYKVGEVKMYHGAVASIGSVWGPGWQLADGTNGTAALKDRFIVGAGATYTPNATGGAATVVLATANLPAHNHPVVDGGHIHGASDSGHNHFLNDPGHFHGLNGALSLLGSGNNLSGGGFTFGPVSSQTSGTGITINPSSANISVATATTGIATSNTGSGTAHENLPPYYALCFIEYTGIGA